MNFWFSRFFNSEIVSPTVFCLSFLRITALLLPLSVLKYFSIFRASSVARLALPKKSCTTLLVFFAYYCVAVPSFGAQILLYIPLLIGHAPCSTQKILRNFACLFCVLLRCCSHMRCPDTFVHSAPLCSRALHYSKNPAQLISCICEKTSFDTRFVFEARASFTHSFVVNL